VATLFTLSSAHKDTLSYFLVLPVMLSLTLTRPTVETKMNCNRLIQNFDFPLILLFAILLPLASAAITVSNTVLVFARDTASAYSVTSGLAGHGIPYQLVIVPQAGITLPTLSSSATSGNYGGILILSDVAYNYSTGWTSALTAAQLTQLYTYQTTFGVRMVRLDSFPTADYGMYFVKSLREPSIHNGFPTQLDCVENIH
jgi:hypothetical protein